MLLREQHAHARIFEHEGEPVCRVVRIERDIRASSLEYAEHGHEHLVRALEADAHTHLRADAERAKVMANLLARWFSSP